MTSRRKVLVTGAIGRLGTAVCRALLEHGHEVVATDLRFAPGFPVRIELGDLRDELFAYRVVEGADTVVHCANHPNAFAGPSPPRLLAENVAMNANVFWAATDLGVRRLVFASSIQVMLQFDGFRRERPYALPYLPLDGEAPTDPGTNTYALSKEHAERMLRLLCQKYADLAVTVLRFPMLAPEHWLRHMTSMRQIPADMLPFWDCLAYLQLPDAGEVVSAAVEQPRPGYRQYFPAASLEITNYPVADIVRDHYSHVRPRRPGEPIDRLIDVSALTADVGWKPTHLISVELAR